MPNFPQYKKSFLGKSEKSILFDPEMSVLLLFLLFFGSNSSSRQDMRPEKSSHRVKLFIEFPYLSQIIFNWYIYISK